MRVNIPELPPLIWVIFLSTVMSLVGGDMFGYRFSGWGWVIPFVFALMLLPQNIANLRFPIFIWAPWILLLIGHLIFTESPAFQRTVQLIAPIIVGTTVSCLEIPEEQLEDIFEAFKYLAGTLTGIIIVSSGLLLTGAMPATSGLAPQVMTNILLSIYFATSYAFGERKHFLWWAVLAVNPVIALTRTAIAVNLLTLPVSFGPFRLSKRILLLLVVCLVGLAIFYSPRAQKKSFREGSGEMSDVLSKNFNDSGRFAIWKELRKEIEASPWFGHGTGACEVFVRKLTKNIAGYPHNDWLLLLYDHGKFGTYLFALTNLLAMMHAYRSGRRASGKVRILYLTGAASFITLALMMYTDNITVYASYYGNLQFTFLGLAYAVDRKKE